MVPVTSLSDLLLLPILLVIAAAFAYLAPTLPRFQEGKKPPIRWLGLLFAILALYIGMTHFFDIFNAFYKAGLVGYGKRVTWGHYVAPLPGLIAIIAIAGLEWKLKKQTEEFHI